MEGDLEDTGLKFAQQDNVPRKSLQISPARKMDGDGSNSRSKKSSESFNRLSSSQMSGSKKIRSGASRVLYNSDSEEEEI